MFDLSSEITLSNTAQFYLRERGFTFPDDGKVRLFILINSQNTINEFLDCLLFIFLDYGPISYLLRRISINDYIEPPEEKLREFIDFYDQGKLGIC